MKMAKVFVVVLAAIMSANSFLLRIFTSFTQSENGEVNLNEKWLTMVSNGSLARNAGALSAVA